jgi:hypothetical protein
MTAVTTLVRSHQSTHGLTTDGKAGPATLARIEDPPFQRPVDRADVYTRLGTPGHGTADPDWERANIVECHVRGDRPRLPGVPEKWWVKVNKHIEPSLRAALDLAREYAPEYSIERLGCYVFRHQRHDSSRPLSYHSWGIAVDIDPSRNSAKTFKNGTAPEPWSPEWMAIWPDGMPRDFIRAFEESGWKWGGRWKTYSDGMHLELVG